MKLAKPILFVVAGAVIASSVILVAQQRYSVKAEFSNDGLKSLRSNGFDFFQSGSVLVHEVVLRSATGETHPGATEGDYKFNPERQEVVRTFPWGQIKLTYAASHNQLLLTINTTNTSDSDTIEGLWYQPITLKLPAKAKEYDGSIPLLADNVGGVGVSKLSFGSGSLAAVSEDVAKPLLVGFPWADNRPENTIFPLSVSTGRVKSYPDSIPRIDRPIPPKSSDEFKVALRFGSASQTEAEFAEDIYKMFGETYPSKLNWSDRRPIGAIFLSSSGETTETNPRAWFNDHNLNINTPSGCAEFRQKILMIADNAVAIMKDMHAQGAITWDIEGAQYTHANYIGDPRMVNELAPEMADLADEYFARFRAANLRVGVCVRPQQLQLSPDKKTATQMSVADPTQLLIDKIGYAKKRWGASIIYIDSNVNSYDSNPLDAAVMEKVSAAFPDVLLVPEHSTLRYYAYSAPYRELRQGFTGTPETVLSTYPKAFTLIYTADGLIDYYHKNLGNAVKHGDALMYRTWWRDPQNEKVKTLALR
jgi:hypothetical protein